MKSLTEKLYESINDTTLTGFENNDMFTREYNNLFGMMSNTILRKVDTILDRPVYVLTGSALRGGVQFLSSFDVAVATPGNPFTTPSEFLHDRGYDIYDATGSTKNLWPHCADDSGNGSVENTLDPIIVSAVADMIDDDDYLIVA